MPKLHDLLPTLMRVFGFEDLRDQQKPIVSSIMANRDVLAILKTSGGKSLCYQLPAVFREGTTLVVSPLISLMKDQVDALNRKGVSAAFVNSSLDAQTVQASYMSLARGQYTLFYVSPERFADPAFAEALAQSPLHTIAIDEAHCASQWGHDFRPNYSRLGQRLDELDSIMGRRLQRLAFTATATARVQEDIIAMLGLQNPDRHIQDFDRENLSYTVLNAKKSSREREVLQMLNEHPGDVTIIYCVTVKAVERLYQNLKDEGVMVDRYHGRLSPDEKNRVQDEFLEGRIPVLVSTSAFGMGVDKADVRLVIHAQMPGSLEAWYQEAGRAGRDGKPAKAILLYHESDKSIHHFFINASSPPGAKIEPIKDRIGKLLADGPASLNPKALSLTCTRQLAVINAVMPDNGLPIDEITPSDVQATIGLLVNQGEIEDYDGMYALSNWLHDADYSWIDEVKKHNWQKYNAMCSWSETHLCRRWQILRYFDERKSYYQCGNCDNCQAEALSRLKHKPLESTVRPTTLLNLAKALNALGSCKGNRWVHVLLGTIESKELLPHEIEHTGRFTWNAVSDITRWRNNLIACEMMTEDHVLTSKGKSWIDGKVELPAEVLGKPIPSSVAPAFAYSKEARLKGLKQWRKVTANREDVSTVSLATEAQMLSLSLLDELTPNGLASKGFSAGWIKKHGRAVLACLNKIDADKEMFGAA